LRLDLYDTHVAHLLASNSKGIFSFCRQLNENEIGCRIKIILAGFIDDPEVTLLHGIVIGKNDVYLPLLKVLAVLVLNAQREAPVGMWLCHRSIQESLDFHLLAAEAVCFIPVQFSQTHVSVLQTHPGNALQLSPSSRSELPSQSHDIVDIAANGNHLDVAYLIDYFKIHETCLENGPDEYAMLQSASDASIVTLGEEWINRIGFFAAFAVLCFPSSSIVHRTTAVSSGIWPV
jgi:hypothetical protein